jgi:protein tyrosine/serine phosphatase
MRTQWGRSTAALVGGALVVAALCGAWVGWIQLFDNVHVEFGGDVVRTAQVDRSSMAKLLREHGIKTVINLRGSNPGDDWFDGEVAAAEQAGVRHVSLGLSANQEPAGPLLASLVDTLKTAPKPFLIHCNWGADRTGLASALYGLVVKKLPADQAAHQLSFRYGHFPWLTSNTVAMDRTFWRVASEMNAP